MRSGSRGANGARTWLVPDGYLPPDSTGPLASHEAICVLNCNAQDAHVSFTFYFEDRDPIRDVAVTVPSERTRHVRMDQPRELNGTEIPKGIPYAMRIESDVLVTVQHSRLDTSQEALALMTTLAYPVTEP